FRRKYGPLGYADRTLLEILGDDHLGEKAKNVFLAIPQEKLEEGFEAVVKELERLLSSDSTAARMRALNELRNLKLRPNQSISEFCVVLEKLARKANPNSSVTERSLEYAQILLDNVREWPEHVQLLSLLHRSDPGNAYNEIKQLAITIEQARTMYGTPRKSTPTGTEWKKRAQAYKSHRENPPNTEEHQRGYVDEKKEDVETRKCFNCSKLGHIARNCPLRRPVVNNRVEKPAKTKDNKEGTRISDLMRQARSMGMVVEKGSAETDLVGEKSTAWVSMMNERVSALIDTGSMVSIVPVGLLARAQKNGFDVDSLTVIDQKTLDPVYDASNNRMQFLGGVVIGVKIEGGAEYEVAFYISNDKGQEVLLGTNALKSLGVQIQLPKPATTPTRRTSHIGKVTVARRAYIPPYSSALVQARCNVGENPVERVIWPASNGIAAGVFKIENNECAIPIINEGSEPMMFREGDEIGHWSTDKWREGWDEEFKPTILEERCSGLGLQARKQKLFEQISQNRSSTEIPEDIRKLVEEKGEAFAVCDQELSATSEVEMDVDTGDHPPIKLKARPVPLAMRAKLREMLNDLVSRKIIEKSASAWAFPIVLVEKKDGSLRLCVDYRELNKCIRQDAYPMPTIDAMLQSMAGGISAICETLRRCQQQLEEGGRIVSVWPPLMESNQTTWRQLTEVWQMIDNALQGKAGPHQLLTTASHRMDSGKIFIEAGAPEGCLNFYGKNL
ncbi:zinc knuckle, partial [Ostertagia ostertagi]